MNERKRERESVQSERATAPRLIRLSASRYSLLTVVPVEEAARDHLHESEDFRLSLLKSMGSEIVRCGVTLGWYMKTRSEERQWIHFVLNGSVNARRQRLRPVPAQ